MGLKPFKIADDREAIELKCDSPRHRGEKPTVWFDGGSRAANLTLALTTGWKERHNSKGAWLCPQCVDRNAQKRAGRAKEPMNLVRRYVNGSRGL